MSCLHVVMHSSCIVAERQGCTDEADDTILKRLSVGATHVERLQETTELQNPESYSTGHATVMILVFLLCWEFR